MKRSNPYSLTSLPSAPAAATVVLSGRRRRVVSRGGQDFVQFRSPRMVRQSVVGVSRPIRVPRGAIAPYAGRRELGYLDTDMYTSPLEFSSTGSVTCLNLLAEGDDNTNRKGRMINARSVELRGWIAPETAASAAFACLCRMMLVWDNATNSGALPAITDILQVARPESLPRVDFSDRFTVLWDQSFAASAYDPATGLGAPTVIDVHKYLALNCSTRYSGTSATIGSIANGALYFVIIGPTAAASLNYTFRGISRFRFEDG